MSLPFSTEPRKEALERFIVSVTKVRYLPLVCLLLFVLLRVFPKTYSGLHLHNIVTKCLVFLVNLSKL